MEAVRRSEAPLDAEGEEVGRRVGEALRARRKALGKTMQQVANEAGLTASFISQIERGLSTPSLTSFYKIARALETSMEALLEMPPSHSPITRAGTREVYNLGDPSRTYEYLGSGFSGAKLHACLVRRPPGHVSEIFRHEGEEFVYLLKGTIDYRLDEDSHVLTSGDTIHFDSTREHSSIVSEKEDAIELWIGTMPIYET